MVLDPVSLVVGVALAWIVIYAAGFLLKIGGDDFGILPLIIIFRWRRLNSLLKNRMERLHAKFPQLTNIPVLVTYALLFTLPLVLAYNIFVKSSLLYLPPSFPPDIDGLVLILVSMSVVFVIRGLSGHLFSLGEKVEGELVLVIVGVVAGIYSRIPGDVVSYKKARITAARVFSHVLMLMLLLPMLYSFNGIISVGFTPSQGALVTNVGLSSPAYSIGFREGMVITEISELRPFGSVGRTIKILSPLDVSFAMGEIDGDQLWNITTGLLEVRKTAVDLGLAEMGVELGANYIPSEPWMSSLVPYFTKYLIGWLININLGFLLIGLIPYRRLDGYVLIEALSKEFPESRVISYFGIVSKWVSFVLLALFTAGLL